MLIYLHKQQRQNGTGVHSKTILIMNSKWYEGDKVSN